MNAHIRGMMLKILVRGRFMFLYLTKVSVSYPQWWLHMWSDGQDKKGTSLSSICGLGARFSFGERVFMVDWVLF